MKEEQNHEPTNFDNVDDVIAQCVKDLAKERDDLRREIVAQCVKGLLKERNNLRREVGAVTAKALEIAGQRDAALAELAKSRHAATVGAALLRQVVGDAECVCETWARVYKRMRLADREMSKPDDETLRAYRVLQFHPCSGSMGSDACPQRATH